ncbi:MAG: FapA family protein [Geopsychrobacter sp.]|nr:FapA family protein [Geopsychrobacter sp.]
MDGWFELDVKTPGNQPEYRADEKGNVDLRTLYTCTEIIPDQKLGIVHPPQDGVAGLTANGLTIPAERGKPFDLIAGEGVILKYDNRIAFAEKSGRALFDKKTLSVVDELVISGDLDLKVGNIDFHGFVEISGDVPDDFSVKASKGVRIAGTIGACQIDAGGSIEIGSMVGKNVGQILCQGDLHANYLNQTNVICYGNVFVVNEIRNSQIKSTGKIVVERGSIIGGRCVALEGIEAKNLGATSCVQTDLVAGVYFPDDDRFNYLFRRLQEINDQLKSIYEALGPLERLKEQSESLVNAVQLRLTILSEQWEKLEQEKEQVTAELGASKPQVFSCCNPKINALTVLNEGVVVHLGQALEKIKTEMSGPLTLIENTREGGLRFLSLSPLNQQAAEIEAEILEDSPVPDESSPDAEEWTEPKGEMPGSKPGWAEPESGQSEVGETLPEPDDL